MCSIDTRHYLPRKGKNVTSTPVTVYQTGLCLECRGFLPKGFRNRLKSQGKSPTHDPTTLDYPRRHYHPPEAPTGRQSNCISATLV